MGWTVRERGGEPSRVTDGPVWSAELPAHASTAGSSPGIYGADSQNGARSHRLGGPSQDQAVYSCHCGYVFEALVSTSVDCPHCGGPQAW